MTVNELSTKVIGKALKVHTKLGPGLLESIYKECLFHELIHENILVEIERPLPVYYENKKMDCGYRLDLVVENKLVIEIKSVESINPIHIAQVLTYLRVGDFQLGLLLNFNVVSLKEGIKRIINTRKKVE